MDWEKREEELEAGFEERGQVCGGKREDESFEEREFGEDED